jgi:hypothetical protein
MQWHIGREIVGRGTLLGVVGSYKADGVQGLRRRRSMAKVYTKDRSLLVMIYLTHS